MNKVNNERRSHPRKDCTGFIMFNVLSDDLNFIFSANSSCIKGIAQPINISEDGIMMKLFDMLGLSDNPKGFSSNIFKGALIEFRKPDDGKKIRAEIIHVSGNNLGVRYL